MNRIQLWLVEEGPRALRVEELSDTETERQLEDLLVGSSDVLMEGLTVVARQLQTGGGPLDMLGVDPEGRLVIFELKRGVLTREAVAQVIDYASDFAERSREDIGRLIEEYSGHGGVQKIDDFLDWYGREYPDSDDVLDKTPKMVLVGLGADERATRMVDFLAGSGIDIQLLTFHAFRSGPRLLLARQTETRTVAAKSPSAGSKDRNLQALLESAEQLRCKDLLLTVADYIVGLAPFYRWPGKTAFSFSLPERTNEGRPTSRSYFTLWVDRKNPGAVVLTIPERVVEGVSEAVEGFVRTLPDTRKGTSAWMTIQLTITKDRWDQIRPALSDLVKSMRDVWERSTAQEQITQADAAEAETS
jgi:Endonuclease NucS